MVQNRLLLHNSAKTSVCIGEYISQSRHHTPSIAFRHLPPNSARFSYATERELFISALLSTDAVSAFRKVWVLIKLQTVVYDILPSTHRRQVPESGVRSVGTNMTVEAAYSAQAPT